MPIPSPFHSRTASINENQEWRDWSGYLAPSLYGHTHDREYYAIRASAALIDVSPLFKYEVSGPEAIRLLNRIFTRDISRCDVGQVMYTPWCDDAGKIIDDGTVARLEADRYRITSADPNLSWFQDCAYGMEVDIEDASAGLAAVAVQGPASRVILQAAFNCEELQRLRYYRLAQIEAAGIPVTITRTGYTGDLGYELWVEPRHAAGLWDHLISCGTPFGLAPAGMLALDIARIEAGLIMSGVDYIPVRKALIPNQKSSPFEIGLGWAVGLDKPAFVGRRPLLAEKTAGPRWGLVGLEIDWSDLERVFGRWNLTPQVAGRASRSAIPVYVGRRKIGEVTSHTFSPLLKRYIGLASLRSEYCADGTAVEVEVTVEYTRKTARSRVTRLPFFNPERKRA